MTIRSARIAEALQQGSTWDPDTAAARGERDRAGGEAMGALLGLANPAAGTALTALLSLSAPIPDAEAPSTHPDVQLRVSWRDGTTVFSQESLVISDSVRPMWNYAFLVRASALGSDGVRVLVQDVDGEHQPALIGEVTLSPSELRDAIARNELVELRPSDNELLELRAIVTPVENRQSLPTVDAVVQLRDGLFDTGLEVPAGVAVFVSSTGEGRVSAGGLFSCGGPNVTPAGLAGNACRGHNLIAPALRDAPHGSAIVMVGGHPGASVLSLGAIDARSTPCIAFVAARPGRVVLGVNDRSFGNNSGAFVFRVEVIYPPDGAPLPPLGRTRACATVGEH